MKFYVKIIKNLFFTIFRKNYLCVKIVYYFTFLCIISKKINFCQKKLFFLKKCIKVKFLFKISEKVIFCQKKLFCFINKQNKKTGINILFFIGPEGIRTPDLMHAMHAL